MSASSGKISLLIVLTVVAVATTLSVIVAFTYVQVRAELTEQALHAVENRLRSQQRILVENLRMIAESQKSVLSFFAGTSDVSTADIRTLQRGFARNHASVRSTIVFGGEFEPVIAPDYFGERLRRSYVPAESAGITAGIVAPAEEFAEAGGWYIGRAFADSFGLRSILPVAVFDFRGVRQTTGAIIAVDISQLFYDSISEFSIQVDDQRWPVEAALYDREGRLLATSLNHLRQRHPILDETTNAQFHSSGSNYLEWNVRRDTLVVSGAGLITEVVHESSTGLFLAGSVPEPAITRRIAYLSSQIVIIGVLCIVVISLLGFALFRTAKQLASAEEQRAEMHARSIQAVIGPHFLFNSLDTIVGLASQKDYQALMKTLKALTIQLEGAVRNFENEASVAQEMSYVESYLEIQSRRYRGRFIVDTHVDPETEMDQIPRFCIQPIVENCFTHAIPYCEHVVSIAIRVCEVDASTVGVFVTDNGPGISDGDRDHIESTINGEHNPERHGVGMYTVHSRLTNAYGKGYGIRLVRPDEHTDFGGCRPKSGMSVLVLLPKTG